MQQINIDKAMRKTEITGQSGQVYVVEIQVTANAKRIRITNKDNGEKKKGQTSYFEQLLKKT
jgi:hypothetical protein